jgi:hypothetical protein
VIFYAIIWGSYVISSSCLLKVTVVWRFHVVLLFLFYFFLTLPSFFFVGTGYLTACFALMVGPQGCAVGVEHIPELVSSSIQNIQKSAAAPLLKEGSLSVHAGGMYLRTHIFWNLDIM